MKTQIKNLALDYAWAVLLGMFLLFFATACDKGKTDCGDVPKPSQEQIACGLEVRAVQMPCSAYGAFGNIYFQTKEGKYLQPWEMFPTLVAVKVVVGKTYTIGYKEVKRDNERYKDIILCALFDEKVANATPIKLICLTEKGAD